MDYILFSIGSIDFTVSQVLITVLCTLNVVAVQFDNIKIRRWASVFALLGEPLWLATSWENEQWGVFFATFVYTTVWGIGFYRAWITPMTAKTKPDNCHYFETSS